MVHPNPNAQPMEKWKGKATAPTTVKTSSASVPKKQKGGEATSSSQDEGLQEVAAMEASRPRTRGERGYGLKSIPLSAKKWYKIRRLKHIHPYLAMEEHQLRSKHQAI